MSLKKLWIVTFLAAGLAIHSPERANAQERNILEEIQAKIESIKTNFESADYRTVISEGRDLFYALDNPRQRIQIGKIVLRSYLYLLDLQEEEEPELMAEFLDFAKLLATKTKDDEIYADIGKYSYERYLWARKSGILDEEERSRLRRESLLYLWKAIAIREIEEGHNVNALDDELLFAYVRLFSDICMDFSIIECDSNAYIALMRHVYETATIGATNEIFEKILSAHQPDDNAYIIASYLKAIGRIMEYDDGNLCASTYFEKAKITGKQLEYETDPDKKVAIFELGHEYLENAAKATHSLTTKADRYMDLATYLKMFEMLRKGSEFSQLLQDIIKYMRLAFLYNPENNDIRTFYGYALIDYVRDCFNRREYEDAKRYAVEGTTFEWSDIESGYYELSRIQSYIDGEELKAYQNALQALKILDKKYPPSQDAEIEDLNVITKKLNFINQVRLTSEPISAEKRKEMEMRKAVLQGKETP